MHKPMHLWSIQFSSVTQSWPTLCNPINHSTPGLPVHHHLPSPLKPMSTESVMPSSHLILCHPLLLLPSTFPSIRVSSNWLALHIRWSKYWSFCWALLLLFRLSGVSDSLHPHGLQHASFPVIHYLLEFPQTHVH